MSLTLYYHPLASDCHKVLIALYENATAFAPRIIDEAWPYFSMYPFAEVIPQRFR